MTLIAKELITSIKQGNVRKFYKSRLWRKKRREILRRDNYECQRCKSKGKYHKAETVHHKRHLKDCPELALVDSNLISLCFNCHNEEHPEKLASQAAERTLMDYRYLQGMTFEWIAGEMHYHWRSVHKIHVRALTKIQIGQ